MKYLNASNISFQFGASEYSTRYNCNQTKFHFSLKVSVSGMRYSRMSIMTSTVSTIKESTLAGFHYRAGIAPNFVSEPKYLWCSPTIRCKLWQIKNCRRIGAGVNYMFPAYYWFHSFHSALQAVGN
jgi:hypothetical protein